MAHTPGPWAVARKRGPLHGIGATDPLAIKDSTGEYVATLGGGSVHFANADANARLIAAAPDLLAALKAALPYLEHSVKFYRYQQAGHEFWPNREEAEGNITEARAAIAKAEGK